MKLKKIEEALLASEVFTFELAGDNGLLDPKFKQRMYTLINLALSDLHQRFHIREESVLLKANPDIKRYQLIPENSVLTKADGYILDTAENPFKGDILEVLRVKLPNQTEHTINQVTNTHNFYGGVYHNGKVSNTSSLISTPTSSELSFSTSPTEAIYEVIYKADSLPIDIPNATSDTEVIIHNTYLNAICYFVASKMYNPAGAESIGRSMFHEGNNWSSKYEDECRRIKDNLSGNKSLTEMSNFERGGWV